MRFAFSTAACRNWDFQTIAARAAEMKYQGVELHGSFRESDGSAANLFLTDPAKLLRVFTDHGIAITCITSPSSMSGAKAADVHAADDCRRTIDTAARLGCQLVKISDGLIPVGTSRTAAGMALGDWLMPLGDYAAQRNISLVLENARGARSSREMWLILDRISHPAIGCAWNILNASLIGESPFVSVPTLSSRIEYAVISDAKIASAVEYCQLGEGDVPVEKFVTRLRGIGYEGWVTVSGREEMLTESLTTLHEWIQARHITIARKALT
jgi:sugar phosphate isomerase/epimerase